jgi:hypothetical protein
MKTFQDGVQVNNKNTSYGRRFRLSLVFGSFGDPHHHRGKKVVRVPRQVDGSRGDDLLWPSRLASRSLGCTSASGSGYSIGKELSVRSAVGVPTLGSLSESLAPRAHAAPAREPSTMARQSIRLTAGSQCGRDSGFTRAAYNSKDRLISFGRTDVLFVL